MKNGYLIPNCAVQSISYTPERRVITLASTAPNLIATQRGVKRRGAPFLLKILMSSEAVTSFKPVIRVCSQQDPEPSTL